MQASLVEKLKKETKKFCGFRTPDNVREIADVAVKYMSSDMEWPIDDPANPIIRTFTHIFDTKKTAKTALPLSSVIWDMVKVKAITGTALTTVLRKMESFKYSEPDATLKTIPIMTQVARDHFLELTVLQAILSQLLSLSGSKPEVLRQTAGAAAGDIVLSFLTFAKDGSAALTDGNRRDIDLCFGMSCSSLERFEDRLYKVVYLILRDLSSVCCGKAPVWLRLSEEPPVDVCYGILEDVIRSQAKFLDTSPHFLKLITNVAMCAHERGAPVGFCVKCVDALMEKIPEASSALFSDFIRDIDNGSPNVLTAVSFFRVLLLKNADVIVRFCLACDIQGKLMNSLIDGLRGLCQGASEAMRIEIGLTPKLCDYQATNPVGPAVELAIYFVQSCYKAQNSALKPLVNETWGNILAIFSVAAAIVKGGCCYILLQGMHSLAVLATELNLEDARGSSVSTFCSVLVAPKGPEADEVRRIAYETVTSAIETTPVIFKGHWSKLLVSMSEFRWKPSSPEFTVPLSLGQVTELGKSLVAVDDGSEETRTWALSLVASILVANISRFGKLWPAFGENIVPMVCDGGTAALTVFLILLRDGFGPTSEEQLCIAIKLVLAPKSAVSPDGRIFILESVGHILANSGSVISRGWPHIIQALKPMRMKDGSEFLGGAFRSVQIIANDLMFSLNGETQTQMTKIIFEFADQMIDVNISLSAFGLLWNTVTVCRTPEMWRLVFDGIAPLVGHPVPDVSLCAVNTFFSLVVSNTKSIPESVYEHLAADLFMPIIDTLIKPHDESVASQQLAFQQLAHCGRNLWDKFKSVETFRDEMWRRLVTEYESFIQKCDRRDIRCAAHQFYEEVLQCPEMSYDVIEYVFSSLNRLISVFLLDTSVESPFLSAFGRLVRQVMPAHKDRMTAQLLRRWVGLIERAMFECECGALLPPTAHKTLDALTSLFPLPLDLGIIVYESMVGMALNEKKNVPLTELSIRFMRTVCNEKVGIECIPTFFVMSVNMLKLEAARDLLLDFIRKKVDVQDDMLDLVADSLMEIAVCGSSFGDEMVSPVLELFPRLRDKSKLRFIECCGESYSMISGILGRFCNPESTEFVPELACVCTKLAIDKMGMMISCANDAAVKEMAEFLLKLRTSPDVYGESSDQFHLVVMLHMFADLVLHPDEGVRKELRKILLAIADVRNAK